MRIQDVSKKTGLTKKAIHFYVSEGLIRPAKTENNYYVFNNLDLDMLNQIMILRKSGLSIQTIKEIYTYPAAANFFLHRSFNELKKEIIEKITELENLKMILETISPNATLFDIGDIPADRLKQHSDPLWLDQMYPSNDERMIAILLLAPFLDVPVDEYRNYLWDKIFMDLKYQFKDNIPILSELIYSLSGNQIRESSTFQFNLMTQLAESDETEAFISYLNSRIEEICIDRQLQMKWTLLHESVLQPVKLFFNRTREKKRIAQYNPRFEQSSVRIAQIVQMVSKSLTEKQKTQLSNCLDHRFSFDQETYSDLFLLFTFHKSIYAMCSIETIQRALKSTQSR